MFFSLNLIPLIIICLLPHSQALLLGGGHPHLYEIVIEFVQSEGGHILPQQSKKQGSAHPDELDMVPFDPSLYGPPQQSAIYLPFLAN